MSIASQPKRRVTQKEIAARAGVSQFTVSAVLGGGQVAMRYPEATRRRIAAAASDAGYRPSRAAQSLRTGLSGAVGLWMVRTHIPAHVIYSYNLHRTARLNKKHLLLSETTDGSDDIRDNNDWEWPVDAVIAVDSADRVLQYRQTNGVDLPIVSAGWFYTDVVDHVGIDVESGASAAMDHIVESGCRDIVYLVPAPLFWPREVRYAAYIDRLDRERLEPHIVVSENYTREGSYAAVKKYLASAGAVDAVFAAGEAEAIGAYRALREAGRRVPDDVIIVAFGDEVDDLPYFETPISGVAAPIAQVCEIAWEYLQNRQNDPTMPLQGCVLPMSLNIRSSSVRPRRTGS